MDLAARLRSDSCRLTGLSTHYNYQQYHVCHRIECYEDDPYASSNCNNHCTSPPTLLSLTGSTHDAWNTAPAIVPVESFQGLISLPTALIMCLWVQLIGLHERWHKFITVACD